MTKSFICALGFAMAASFASANELPLNNSLSGGTGSEAEVGQGGALLAGTISIPAVVVGIAVIAVVAASSGSSSATTTTSE